MSRRLSFPLTLVGLLAAAAASAQPPAPTVRDAAWSFSVSRPTAEAPQPVQPAGHTAPAVAPPPRTKAAPLDLGFRAAAQDLNLAWTVTGPGSVALTLSCCATTTVKAPCCEAACCDQPCPAPTAATPVRLVTAGPARPAPAVPPVAVAVRTAAATYRPLGTWYKEAPGVILSLTFGPDGDTLTAKACYAAGDGAVVTCTLTADCAVTKDGTVHGVITGTDLDGLADADGEAALAALAAVADQPFAFRCRPADGGLMVGQVRIAAGKSVAPDLAPPEGVFAGKFRPAADGKVPAPKPAKAAAAAVGMTPPPPVCLVRPGPAGQPVVERIGVDFHVNVPGGPNGPPVLACPPVAGVCPQPVCPPGVPADSWETLVGTFGEMFRATCPPPAVNGLPATYNVGPITACPPPPALPPLVQFPAPPCPVTLTPYSVPLAGPPVCVAGPGPVPGPTVTPVTFAAPAPAPTVRLAPPCPVVAPAARATAPPEGTWFREVGPVRTTLSVKDGCLSLTGTITAEVEGKRITQELLVTADCYATRDGLVGVITGADFGFAGDLPDEAVGDLTKAIAEFGKVQKGLCDKPFALTCRMVDGCLMVSNVRLAAKFTDGPFEGLEDGSVIAGRYKPAGPDGPQKQKAVKAEGVFLSPAPQMTLPSPSYLEHYPQYFEPDPYFPLPRELDTLAPPVDGPLTRNVGAGRCEVAPEPREVVRPAAFGTLRRPDLRQFSQYDSPGFGVHVECNDAPAAKPGKMTVADVVTLAKAGLGDEVIVTQLRVTDSAFVLSVADLVALKRAGVSDAVIVAMQVGGPEAGPTSTGVRFGTDPHVRMELLLNQSEDLRAVGREWRRFWFHDQPSHLTPERVHGGVW